MLTIRQKDSRIFLFSQFLGRAVERLDALEASLGEGIPLEIRDGVGDLAAEIDAWRSIFNDTLEEIGRPI